MKGVYSPHSISNFSLLSESQKNDLHLAALEVLRHTGVRFYHKGALEMLTKAGAFISDGNLVKIPARLVESAFASAPSRVVMGNRNGEVAMTLEGRRVHFGTGSDTIRILDPYTGERRNWTTEDLRKTYRLCDALPNIDFQMSAGIPMDVPAGVSHYQWQYATMFQNTTKPTVIVCNDYKDCYNIIQMAAIAVGGMEKLRECPLLLLYSEPSSPLKQSETAIDKLLLMAETELPVVHSPGNMMGATAAITMAGGLVISIAEIMSAIVVHQLKNPGAPFVFGNGLHHMDMRSMQISYGSPEFSLTRIAVAEMGRFYGIPTWGYSACSDAKVMDEQAAVEATQQITMTQLSGCNLIHDVGYMESGLTMSLEMVVLADELIAMTDNLVKGIEVSEETLMVKTIHEVGPDSDFLAHPSTKKHYRDFWVPNLLDRYTYEDWTARGQTTLGQRLNKKVRQLVEEHQPQQMEKDKVEKMLGVLYS